MNYAQLLVELMLERQQVEAKYKAAVERERRELSRLAEAMSGLDIDVGKEGLNKGEKKTGTRKEVGERGRKVKME